MAVLNLSAPWQIYYRELSILFGSDPDIKIVYDDEEQIIYLYVESPLKAAALNEYLPTTVEFGGVILQIAIIPANEEYVTSRFSIYDAFNGNPIVSYIRTITGAFSNPITYVVFENTVVQYFNDNIYDAHGVCSTLYQELAKKILTNTEGIFFCTDIDTGSISIGKPLGEWP